MNNNNNNKNIAFVGSYYPIYRKHLFEYLSNFFNLDIYHDLNYQSDLELVSNNSLFSVIDSRTIKIPFLKLLNFQPKAIKCILKKKYDAIILPLRVTDLNSWLSLFLFSKKNTKVILWGHIPKTKSFKKVLFLKMLKMADEIIVYTDGHKNNALKYGVPKEKVFVAYNTIGLGQIEKVRKSMNETELSEFKKNNDINNSINLLYVGRLHKRKKLDLLISAVKKIISNNNLNVKLLLVGDGEEKENLLALVEKFNINNNIIFFPGCFDEEKLALYFMSSHIFILAGWAGLSIQHAFAYELPVVIPDEINKSSPEASLIQHLKTGYRFKDNDVNSLVKAIDFLINNTAIKNKIIKSASILIKTKYNNKSMAKGFIDAINV